MSHDASHDEAERPLSAMRRLALEAQDRREMLTMNPAEFLALVGIVERQQAMLAELWALGGGTGA